MGLYNEIFEQPEILENLILSQMETVRGISDAMKNQEINYLLLAARGTSDHAGIFAKYLFGIENGLPVALAAPSIFSKYSSPPNIKNAIVMGISQSGESPDIISVLTEANKQNVPTIAITNSPDSPLAIEADYILDIVAGEERAVAATKTYTAQIMAICMLSVAMRDNGQNINELKRVPGLVEEVLKLDQAIKGLVYRYRFMKQCVVLGRGLNYATAFEWSLKLKELTYVMAEPYSPADFQHGPIAIIEKGFPVLAIVTKGAVRDEMVELLYKLRETHQADLLVVSNDDEALALADAPLKMPENMPEWISPIINIVVGQLFTYHLTVLKGLDPENPRGLNKVTKTR